MKLNAVTHGMHDISPYKYLCSWAALSLHSPVGAVYRYYGLDNHMSIKDHDGLNEMFVQMVMVYFPEQLCVRGGKVSYTALLAQCMVRLPQVVFTTMWTQRATRVQRK